MIHMHTYPYIYENMCTSHTERWEWALAPGLKEYSCLSLQIAGLQGTHHCVCQHTWHPVVLKRLCLSSLVLKVGWDAEKTYRMIKGMKQRWACAKHEWETCLYVLIKA